MGENNSKKLQNFESITLLHKIIHFFEALETPERCHATKIQAKNPLKHLLQTNYKCFIEI